MLYKELFYKKLFYLSFVLLAISGLFMAFNAQATTIGTNISSSGTLTVATTTPYNGFLDINGNLNQVGGYSIYQNYLPVFTASSTNYSLSVGTNAGYSLTDTGKWNTFLGYRAGYNTNEGDANIAIGADSLYSNNSGYNNIAIGADSLYSNATGYKNVAIGTNALYDNTSGRWNVAIGSYALQNNTTGYMNTAVGESAGDNNTTGHENTYLGDQAGMYNYTGSGNVGVGQGTLWWNEVGSWNTAVGFNALGYQWAQAFANTGIGYEAGLGHSSGYSNASSTWVGYQAGKNIRTGNSNIALGYKAADNLTTGSNNIVIGYDIDAPSATGSNRMTIGNIIFGNNIDGTGTSVSSGAIGIATSTPGGTYGEKLTVVGDSYVSGNARAATITATTALVAPIDTTPNAGDSCAGTTAGAIRIDADAAAGSRIIWCDGSNWQAN